MVSCFSVFFDRIRHYLAPFLYSILYYSYLNNRILTDVKSIVNHSGYSNGLLPVIGKNYILFFFSDKNKPLMVKIIPTAEKTVSFSWRIRPEVTTVTTGTI